MSGFLNAHLLWGLLLLAAPIIIHLLNKRRFEIHPWGAMDFLLKADVKNRRRLRLEDLLLLLLRAGVIAAAVFLVARPLVEGIGGGGEGVRTIVADDSFSMDHRPSVQSALERARDETQALVAEAIASGARVTVRRGTRPAEEIGRVEGPVKSGEVVGAAESPGGAPAPSSAESGSKLVAALKGLEARDGSLRFAEAVEAEAKAVEEDREVEPRALFLVSDFRRQDWLDGSGGLLPRLKEAFKKLSRAAGERVHIQFIDVGEPRRENTAAVRVAVELAQPVAGVPVRIAVEARNFGSEERRGLAGEIEIGDPQNPTHRIPLPAFPPIPPGASASVEIEHTFAEAGEHPVSARLDGDHLVRDDRTFAIAVVREALSVLVVDGDPGSDRLAGEAGFLAAALTPRGKLSTGIRAEVAALPLDSKLLEGRDCVLLLNCAEIDQAEHLALDRFAREGGGVGFFLGDKVRPESYRDLLGDAGIFPAVLKAPLEARDGARIDFGGFSHPALKVYQGIRDSSLERITAARYYDLSPGAEALVVATFADAARTPAIVERAHGAGRTSLFNLTADRDWTDWPTDPSFPVVLQEWVRHLAPRRGEARSIRVGDALSWPVSSPLAASSPPAPPEGDSEGTVASSGYHAPAVIDPRGDRRPALLEGSTARFDRPDIAGLWRAEGQPARWFAVNRTAAESDLTPAAEGDLRRALAGTGLRIAVRKSERAPGEEDEGGDIWRWLALSAGLLLLAELGAAHWFGRR